MLNFLTRLWHAMHPTSALVKSYEATLQYNSLKEKDRNARLVFDMRVGCVVCLCSVEPYSKDHGVQAPPHVRGDQTQIAFHFSEGGTN